MLPCHGTTSARESVILCQVHNPRIFAGVGTLVVESVHPPHDCQGGPQPLNLSARPERSAGERRQIGGSWPTLAAVEGDGQSQQNSNLFERQSSRKTSCIGNRLRNTYANTQWPYPCSNVMSCSGLLVGGRQEVPRHTTAKLCAALRSGSRGSVSASTGGSSCATCARVKRITLLFTA